MATIKILLIALGAGLLLLFGGTLFFDRSSAKETTRRLQTVRTRHAGSTSAKMEAQVKRAVAAYKTQDGTGGGLKSQIAALSLRLYRTGKEWTTLQYLQASAALSGAVALLVLFISHNLVAGVIIGLVVGMGLPHMAISYLIKKRVNAFTIRFADAIELLVRGLRSGLPVTETLTVVANEIPGPVGEEFKLINERIRIGQTMDSAMQETAERLAMPEFNFFCITLAIQRETGGNLTETLANLADVLRKRAQMKLKIKAMSSESKASAYIVGALPFMVFLMIEWANPTYLSGFFTERRLIVAGLGGLGWMGIGVFIMAKMVSFEI